MNAPTAAPALPEWLLASLEGFAKEWIRHTANCMEYGIVDTPRGRAPANAVEVVKGAILAYGAECEARGRAEALAEVDAACWRIVRDKHGVGVDGMVALYGFQRGDDGPTEWGEALCEVDEPTPTAALFVAAAAATAAALTPGGAS